LTDFSAGYHRRVDSEATWYTTGDVARLLGVTDRTIVNWERAGLLRAFTTPGGHRRFRASDVEAFLEHRMSGTTSLEHGRRPH
jgi:excisionase family DNA binding protein